MAEYTTAGEKQNPASTDNQVGTRQRYPMREPKVPTRPTKNALKRAHDKDQPTTQTRPRGSDVKQWHEAINNEFDTLECMYCWKMVGKPVSNTIVNAKSVLKRKINEQGIISRYKAPLGFCVKEEHDFHENSFSPLTDLTVPKIILSMALQKKRYI